MYLLLTPEELAGIRLAAVMAGEHPHDFVKRVVFQSATELFEAAGDEGAPLLMGQLDPRPHLYEPK